MASDLHIAVVIPCYNVEPHVSAVIERVPATVSTIVAVDDASRDGTRRVLEGLDDPRLVVVRHEHNQGVGSAMRSGYRAALERGADVCVKVDGDGQMDPVDLPRLLAPLLEGSAGYAKGNRFRDFAALRAMPRLRIFGNGVLSFLTKLVSGYWSLLDPTNGYTAVRSDVLRRLDLDRLPGGYFFETAMLIELNILGVVVRDVALPARYAGEGSSLNVPRTALVFPWLLLRGLGRRFLWRYVIQDFNALTLCVLAGMPAVLFGIVFGSYRWWESVATGIPATAGTVFIAALPIILGWQCLLVALVLDTLYEPGRPGNGVTRSP